MYVVPLAQELRHDLIDIDVARRNRRGFPSSSLFPQLNREIGRGVGNVNEVKDEEDFNPAALTARQLSTWKCSIGPHQASSRERVMVVMVVIDGQVGDGLNLSGYGGSQVRDR